MEFIIASHESLWEAVSGLDAAIILIAILSAVFGFWAGFVWQVMRIGAVLVAFWVAAKLNEPLADSLSGTMSETMSENGLKLIAFAALFLGVLLAAHIIMFVARGPINAIRPEFTDHVLGAGIGFLKGLLICGVLSFLLLRYTPKSSELRRLTYNSPLAQWTGWCARGLSNLMTGS